MSKKKKMLLRKRRIRRASVLLMAVITVVIAAFLIKGGKGGENKEKPVADNSPPPLAVTASEVASGDVNGDGVITAEDALLALRAAVGMETLSASAKADADLNADGKITAADARNILRMSVGLRISDSANVYFSPIYTESQVPEGGKVIYLTFDDGPSENTEEILKILDKYNVKATFFVIKNDNYGQMYKQIVEKGHSIALHSYSHQYARIYKSTDAFFDDLSKISDYVYEKTGVRTRLIRFPGGSSNTISSGYCSGIMSTLARETAARGYVYFDWNSANNDAIGKPLSAEQIRSAANSYTGRSPLVMLMHDAHGKGSTVKSLSGIIENYKNAGYYFLPLNESSPTAHHSIAN